MNVLHKPRRVCVRRCVRNATRAAVALVMCVLGACDVAPEEAVDGMLRAVARGDVRRAGQYVTPELRAALCNKPGCADVVRYRLRSLRWDVQNLYATTNGMLAVVPFASVRETPPPPVLQGVLLVHLVDDGGVWRAAAIEVDIPEYVEFVTTPQGGDEFSMWSMTKPRWERKQSLRERLPDFAQRMETYWRSFRE